MSKLRSVAVLSACCLWLLGCWSTDTTPPIIVDTTPANGAINVPTNITITCTFDETIDWTSLTVDTFTISDGSDTLFPATVSSADLIGTLTPTGGLPVYTECTVTIAESVHDLAGNPLGEDFVWSFTTADRAWGGAVAIDNRDDGADGSSVAAAGDHLAMAVWQQYDPGFNSIYASRHTVAGWQSPILIDGEDTGAEGPQVAINEAGDAVAAWIQEVGSNERVVAAVYTAAGGWSAPQAISDDTSGAWYQQVSIDPDGNAMVVWDQGTDVWHCVYSDTPGTWGGADNTSIATGTDGSTMPQVEFCADGSAYVTWQQGSPYDILLKRRSAAGAWEATATADTAVTFTTGSPHVGTDAAGNAVVLWKEWDGSHDRAMARRYLVGSTDWEAAPALLDDALGASGAAIFPQLGVGANGDAVAVWRQVSNTKSSVYASVYSAGLGWSGAELLEGNDSNACSGHTVAVDPLGRAVAAWNCWDGDYTRTWTARYVGGSWQPEEVADTTFAGNAFTPDLAADATGHMVCVWPVSTDIVAVWFE